MIFPCQIHGPNRGDLVREWKFKSDDQKFWGLNVAQISWVADEKWDDFLKWWPNILLWLQKDGLLHVWSPGLRWGTGSSGKMSETMQKGLRMHLKGNCLRDRKFWKMPDTRSRMPGGQAVSDGRTYFASFPPCRKLFLVFPLVGKYL
jgi:hypothetical protein